MDTKGKIRKFGSDIMDLCYVHVDRKYSKYSTLIRERVMLPMEFNTIPLGDRIRL